MKKLMIGIAATAGILSCSLYELYSAVFCVNDKKFRPTVPKGEQYEARRKKIREMIEEADALPYEEVETVSVDGHRLWGRFYRGKEDAPFELMFHGYKSHAIRDFSGGLPDGVKAGMNVLVVDQRAHGKSEGGALTFGVMERYDVLSWVRYVQNRFGEDRKILLFGISMGAATVLMASDLELPPQVKGIIADCGFSSPEAIIRSVLRSIKAPEVFYHPIRLSGMLFGHFDVGAASAEKALRRCKIPVLFIHGEDDRYVPCEMSRINYEACASEKELLTVPGAGHGISYLCDTEAYREKVNAFIEKTCQ